MSEEIERTFATAVEALTHAMAAMREDPCDEEGDVHYMLIHRTGCDGVCRCDPYVVRADDPRDPEDILTDAGVLDD